MADHGMKKQRDAIMRALTLSKGRVGGTDGASARMGMNRTTLLARMKKFGINPERGRYRCQSSIDNLNSRRPIRISY